MILPFNVCVLMTKMRNYSFIWTPFWTPFGPLLGPKWDGVMASMLCTLSRGIPIILYPIDRPSPEGSRDPKWGAPDHAPEVPSRGARWGADQGWPKIHHLDLGSRSGSRIPRNRAKRA